MQNPLLLLQPLAHPLQQIRTRLLPFPIFPHVHTLVDSVSRFVLLLQTRLLHTRPITWNARDSHPRCFQLAIHYQHRSFQPFSQPGHCTSPPGREINNATVHHCYLDMPLRKELSLPDLHVIGTCCHRSMLSHVSPFYSAIPPTHPCSQLMRVCLIRYGDYSGTPWGVFLTLLGAWLASVKGIATNRILVGRLKFHPLDLLLRMSRK